MGESIFLSALEQARGIREGRFSAEGLVDACLARIAERNPTVNAVVSLRSEAARREARAADAQLARGEPVGVLHGVPITLKDSHDTAGVASTWGTPGRASFVPERNATAAGRLLDAGAILLGKTNTPELTMSFFTENAIFGRTSNPYDPSRTCGGSSGGAAATVALGGAALDLGSDTGGSIRLPSHFCGCAGLRPTSGRVPRTGHALGPGGFLESLTTIGPIARRVEDLEPALALIAGPDGVDPHVMPVPLRCAAKVRPEELRVAFFCDNGVCTPTAETVVAVENAARVLETAGCRVEEARPPGIDETLELFGALITADAGAWVGRVLEEAGTDPRQSSLVGMLGGPGLEPSAFSALVERWDAFRTRMLGFLAGYDAVLCPVCAVPAILHDEQDDDPSVFSYTMAGNLTGWPAAVVRVATAPQGLPLGVQVMAGPWREDIALALAGLLEGALGGWRPPAAVSSVGDGRAPGPGCGGV